MKKIKRLKVSWNVSGSQTTSVVHGVCCFTSPDSFNLQLLSDLEKVCYCVAVMRLYCRDVSCKTQPLFKQQGLWGGASGCDHAPVLSLYGNSLKDCAPSGENPQLQGWRSVTSHRGGGPASQQSRLPVFLPSFSEILKFPTQNNNLQRSEKMARKIRFVCLV